MKVMRSRRFLKKLILTLIVLLVFWSSTSFAFELEWRRVLDSIVIGIEVGVASYFVSYWTARISVGKERVDKGSLYLFSVAVGATTAFAIYSFYDRIKKGKGSEDEGMLLHSHRAEGGG